MNKINRIVLSILCIVASFLPISEAKSDAICSLDGLNFYLALIGDESQEIYGRGCCSWHGGQCGCQGGRIVCCDGSFSPSCGC